MPCPYASLTFAVQAPRVQVALRVAQALRVQALRVAQADIATLEAERDELLQRLHAADQQTAELQDRLHAA